MFLKEIWLKADIGDSIINTEFKTPTLTKSDDHKRFLHILRCSMSVEMILSDCWQIAPKPRQIIIDKVIFSEKGSYRLDGGSVNIPAGMWKMILDELITFDR